MSKRFSETEIWNEDWFLEMPNEYKLFWFYMLSKCDHAGVFKVNLRSFRGLLEVNLTTDKALTYFNTNKQRVRVISDSIWYVEDFFVFQYGTTLNLNSRMHESISEILKKHNIDLTSIRGLKDLKDRVKDKDKDKDKDIVLKGGMGENPETQKKNDMSKKSDTKDVPLPFAENEFVDIWAEWLKYRSERRLGAYTPTGLKRTLNRLLRDCGGDCATAVDMIDYAMSKTWIGIFPIKKEINGTSQHQVATVGQTIKFD